MLVGMLRNWNLVHCWWECKKITATMKNIMVVPQKLNTSSYDPAIPVLGVHVKELKAGSHIDVSMSMFTAALFTIAQMWKQHQVPSTDEWISKMYIYRRILFSFKKEQVLTHATVDEP